MSIETLVEHGRSLAAALFALNRSLGHAHALPYLILPAVIGAIGVVDRVVRDAEEPDHA